MASWVAPCLTSSWPAGSFDLPRRSPAGCVRWRRTRPSGAALRRRRARGRRSSALLRYCCARAGNFRQALDLLFRFAGERRRRHAQLFEQRRHHAVALRDQRPEQMQRLDLLLARSALPSSCAACSASWAFTVSFSKRIMCEVSHFSLDVHKEGRWSEPRSPLGVFDDASLSARRLVAPFVTLIFTCFGLDSARFGISTVSTPFL